MDIATGSTSFVPTPEQKKVIRFRNGHLQVIACAGSGKTETMAQRVVELIAEKVQPEAIIAFTFTERAAAGLKSRIAQRVSERFGPGLLARLATMYVGTIHAFCLHLLQNHASQYENYDILDENQHAALLSREYRRLKLDKLGPQHWRPIADFERNADVVENELIDARKLSGTPFGDCYENYCLTLKGYRFLTYGQLITSAVSALNDPLVFDRVHESLRHLIVDEYQDINPAQEALIQKLSRPPVHLCVVGDDDQAIYQWRGSDVLSIQKFVSRYKAEAFSLSTNRRSRPKIISTAVEFSKTITPRLAKKMKSVRTSSGAELCSWAGDDPEDEAEKLAETVKKILSRGYRPRDIAVLLRSVRTSSAPIVKALAALGIPTRCAGRTGLFLQDDAQLLGKTYAWLIDNEWKTERYGQTESVTLKSLIKEYCRAFKLTSSKTTKLQKHLKDWKDRVQKEDETANLIREYYSLLRLLGVSSWPLSDDVEVARFGSLARFSLLLKDFEHVTRRGRWVEEKGERKFRGGQNRGVWYYRRLFNYMQYYSLDAYEDFSGEDEVVTEAVDVLTIHQAKGLEWPIVFMPCLVANRFPSSMTGRAGNWLISEKMFPRKARERYEGSLTDERRLFYVGITRAKDMLYLSTFRRMKKSTSPSPFFVEVAGSVPDDFDPLPLPEPFVPGPEEQEEQPVFSFSDLAAYENCPFSYRLESLIGFQPQIAQELGYGRAIHHVLRCLADFVKEKKRKPTEAEARAMLNDEFYLPFAGTITLHEMRKAADKLLRRYLADYADDLARVWATERPFELRLENAIVTGRADVILDREGGIDSNMALVDYKTSTDPKTIDVNAFQLGVYAAAGREEGIKIGAAYIHDLKNANRLNVQIGPGETDKAKNRAQSLIGRIGNKDFIATPEIQKCRSCDVRLVCQYGPSA